MGWVTLNAVNAELGSFFYNIYDQYGRQSEEQPDRIGIWRLVYWITMTISNTIAAVVAIIVLLDDSTDDSYKGIYVGVVGGMLLCASAYRPSRRILPLSLVLQGSRFFAMRVWPSICVTHSAIRKEIIPRLKPPPSRHHPRKVRIPCSPCDTGKGPWLGPGKRLRLYYVCTISISIHLLSALTKCQRSIDSRLILHGRLRTGSARGAGSYRRSAVGPLPATPLFACVTAPAPAADRYKCPVNDFALGL